jgi:hypothetical protein
MNLFLLCIGYGIWTKWRWTLYVVRSWNIASRVNYLLLTHILLVKHLLMKVILLMNWVSLWLVEDISSGFRGSIFILLEYLRVYIWLLVLIMKIHEVGNLFRADSLITWITTLTIGLNFIPILYIKILYLISRVSSVVIDYLCLQSIKLRSTQY